VVAGCRRNLKIAACCAPLGAPPTPAARAICAPPAPVCLQPQDDVAGCFEYYAGLAEKLDARQYSPIDVGMDEFSVKVGWGGGVLQAAGAAGVVGGFVCCGTPRVVAVVKRAGCLGVIRKMTGSACGTCLDAGGRVGWGG
jgi:betaine-aldehyde dehydrogenase